MSAAVFGGWGPRKGRGKEEATLAMGMERATYVVTERDLEFMALDKDELPEEFHGHHLVRQGEVDNQTLAEHGFGNNNAERFRRAGRVTGFIKEFGLRSSPQDPDGFNFVAATVAHLFDAPSSVTGWMHEIFLKDFEDHVGEEIDGGRRLISVHRVHPTGFFDEAVGLRVLQDSPSGPVSSTVIDFRVGRILGVAYVGTLGDHQRLELASQVGLALEKRIVSVVLGGG